MDTELASRIDRSIGPAPDTDDGLADLLAHGHRAVRRRHLALGCASAAAVAAVALATAVLSGDSGDRASEVVQQPTGSPTAVDSPTAVGSPTAEVPPDSSPPPPPTQAEVLRVLDRVFVTVDDRGEVTLSEGTVLREVDNPFGVAAPATSLGLEIQVGGGVYWYARFDGPGQGGEAMTYSANEKGPFRAWLNQMSGLAAGHRPADSGSDGFPGIPDLDLVAFVAGTERLAPSAGATILEQRPHVEVGEAFAGPGDRTAVARVRTDADEIYYVLARAVVGEEPQYISVPAAEGGAELDAFLQLARERYASGAGLL